MTAPAPKYTTAKINILGPKSHIDCDNVQSFDCALEIDPGGPGRGSLIAEFYGRTGEAIFQDAHANALRFLACRDACEGFADPSALPAIIACVKNLLGSEERRKSLLPTLSKLLAQLESR